MAKSPNSETCTPQLYTNTDQGEVASPLSQRHLFSASKSDLDSNKLLMPATAAAPAPAPVLD